MEHVVRDREADIYAYYNASAFLMLPVGPRSYIYTGTVVFYVMGTSSYSLDVTYIYDRDAFHFEDKKLETQDNGLKHIYIPRLSYVYIAQATTRL